VDLPLGHADSERFVPHKGPMFLIDRLTVEDLEAGHMDAEVDIHPRCLFHRAECGGVPAWVGFEYMAQTIAALSGRQGARHGGEPKVGFIMGVRDFDCAEPIFPDSVHLRIEVRQEFRDGPVVSFRCRILDKADGERVFARAMVNAIEVDDNELMQFTEAANG
jgi:predicted hotdog family 3-hydroxylacyl-ACP dehydratase